LICPIQVNYTTTLRGKKARELWEFAGYAKENPRIHLDADGVNAQAKKALSLGFVWFAAVTKPIPQ
jgi:hypothetical protein